jgi:hypothetical protein
MVSMVNSIKHQGKTNDSMETVPQNRRAENISQLMPQDQY